MTRAALMLVAVAGLLSGCAGGGARSAATAPAESTPGKPLAYVDGQPVREADLVQPLLEVAGGRVLAEHALDLALRERLNQRGLELTPELIEAERRRLLGALADDEGRAVRLLRELRRRRGLGEARFRAMLRRNAALRLLVADEVEVTDEEARRQYRLMYGPRYRGRILVVPELSRAAALRQRVLSGASFGELAGEHSTDPSAERGGLLPALSPVDRSYPGEVRRALVELAESGEPVSEVIALDKGYALVALERKIEAQPVEWVDVKEGVRAAVRRREQRRGMDRLARRLLEQADVVVLDPALAESWAAEREEVSF